MMMDTLRPPYTEKQISRLIDIPTQRIRPELSARQRYRQASLGVGV